MKTSYIITGVVIVVTALLLVYMKISQNHPTKNDLSNFDRADALIQAVEKKQGLKKSPLDESTNQVAYGTLLFRFVPERNTVETAILVSHTGLYQSFGKEREVNYLKTIDALSDPKIGGMFDTRGALWRFVKETGEVYLYKQYSLDADAATISKELDGVKEVVPYWVTQWQIAVARIVHAGEPAPTEPVTKENNPYKDRL